MNGNVAGLAVVFQPGQNPPAVDVGQIDVEGDGVNLALAHEGQRIGPARGDDALEAVFVRHVEKELRKAGVVFDDQQRLVSGLDIRAVIFELLRRRSRGFARGRRETEVIGHDERVRDGGR